MSAFMKEFKEFALRGNVIDLAIGVLIGGAFSGLVGSLTENIINPIIACVGSTEVGFVIPLINGNVINIGAFISSIINFIIMAFVIFMIMKSLNKIASIGEKKEEPVEEEPTTKVCPYCKSEIAIDATKCPHCTSDVE
ncbi:MAG: large conductance mechanosensitive channel protein MscL [Lachnospiraceae bacterium]|nr:large conductance mechanosensitive channel protein MscL [Lachnospiraceae bacterium]